MSRFLISTQVEAELCPRCRQLVLVGWVEGLHTRVDPAPLTARGELDALLAGKWTYALVRHELNLRDAAQIAAAKAATVLADHTCPAT